MYMHVCTYVSMHVRKHAHLCENVCLCMCVHAQNYAYSANTHEHSLIHICIYIYACTSVLACVHVCVSLQARVFASAEEDNLKQGLFMKCTNCRGVGGQDHAS